MIFINEWLPNPVGTDSKGEFIELFNNGAGPVGLDGWSLQTDGKKKFKLLGSLGERVFDFAEERNEASLKITDGKLFLYDAAGRVADQSVFEGSAPEGESFSRVSYKMYDSTSVYSTIQQFVWSKPTPGAKNHIATEFGVSDVAYPTGVPLNVAGLNWSSVFGFACAAGVIFAAILWYALRKDEKNHTYSPEETKQFGHEVADLLVRKPGKKALVVALQGDLGAGKTTFTQGFFRGLGIKRNPIEPDIRDHEEICDSRFEFQECISFRRLSSKKRGRHGGS